MQSMPLRMESPRHGFSAPSHPGQGPGCERMTFVFAALRPVMLGVDVCGMASMRLCIESPHPHTQGNALGSGTTTTNDQPLEEPKP